MLFSALSKLRSPILDQPVLNPLEQIRKFPQHNLQILRITLSLHN